MSEQKLKTEVFLDADYPNISTDAAEAGIDELRRVTTGIEIVRANRLLRVANPNDAWITSDKLRLPKHVEADLGIVLVNRRVSSENRWANGVANITVDGDGVRRALAVVTVAAINPTPHLTVAHEGGHFFGAKEKGVSWDKEHHCTDTSCLMAESNDSVTMRRPVEGRGVLGWLERQNVLAPRFEVVTKARAESFCDECAQAIEENSLAMQRQYARLR